MATITADTFLDDGVARTAGETWTCNGGRLTIRTDSRWHANSPASMTGSIGSLTISSTLGGGLTIDGRDVRWMAFNTGSGTVPTIGTTVTQGGVSGYLLGVWSAINSAPTAVGAAMPATGFLKFREVTDGPYAAGALTGISASATSPDVVGWIEVVRDTLTVTVVPRLGDFTVRGDWFDLGTTSGAANQLIVLPTNGSATTYTPGIWIATTASPVTAEDWEFYTAMPADLMIAANIGTDARNKFVCMETNGQIRLGHNGTTAIGFIPPAGRAIRIPNVFGRQCLAGSRAVNVLPSSTLATRPDFTTTAAGVIDIEYFVCDWYMLFGQANSVKLHHVATFDIISLTEITAPIDVYDGGNGVSQSIDSRSVIVTSCFAGGRVEKWTCRRFQSGSADHAVESISSIGQTFEKVITGSIQYARSTGSSFQITQCANQTFINCEQTNAQMVFSTSFDCTVDGLDHCDRYVGETNATTGKYAVSTVLSCKNVKIENVTFGLNGTIANVHPYNGILLSGQSQDTVLRNCGTRGAFLDGGSANQAAFIMASSGNNQRMKLQRVYMSSTRTGVVSTQNSDKGNIYENIYGDFADLTIIADINNTCRGFGSGTSTVGQASVYGTMFRDLFTSDTTGAVVLAMNEATAETAAYQTLVSGLPKFTSAGNVTLPVIGDEVQWEMSYRALGHTALANVVPVISGGNVTFSSGSRWGNHDLYFQIDMGSGYGGTWIDLNQTNLALQTGIDPGLGFTLKIRAVCAVASATNLLTYIRINTVTSLTDQTDNLYPLDVANVSVSGLVTGSRVKAYKDSDGTVLFNGLESSGSVLFQTEYVGLVNIEARKASAAPYYQPWLTQITTVSQATTSATALQVLDE